MITPDGNDTHDEEPKVEAPQMDTKTARDLRARVGDFTPITSLIGYDRHGNRRRVRRRNGGPRHWGYWA